MAKNRTKCAIAGCGRFRGPDQIMCREHWFMVPKGLRDRIWYEYENNRGQQSHLEAIRVAIRHVSDRLDENLINS